MKRMMILCAALLSASLTNAQFSKGDKMVGGSVGSIFLNSGNSDVSFPQTRGYSAKSNNWGVRIEPTFGWFITDKTVIGASLMVNPTGQRVDYKDLGTTFQQDKSTGFNIGLGGFIRNYFGSPSDFRVFGQFGFNTGLNNTTTSGFRYYTGTPDSKVTYDGKSSGGLYANATLQLGFTRMMGEQTGLDFYIGYNYSYNKNTFKTVTLTDLGINGSIDTRGESEPTTRFTNHGMIVGVGFQVFLKGKKK